MTVHVIGAAGTEAAQAIEGPTCDVRVWAGTTHMLPSSLKGQRAADEAMDDVVGFLRDPLAGACA